MSLLDYDDHSLETPRSHAVLSHTWCREPNVTAFVGREADFAEIRGVCGIGKTQLATEYALGRQDDSTAVLWTDGRDEASLQRSYIAIAGQLGHRDPSLSALKLAAESADPTEAVDAVLGWLDRAENAGWLLIIDNAGTPQVPGIVDGLYDIQQYLPTAPHGHVLITTTSSELRLGQQIQHQGRLKQLEAQGHNSECYEHLEHLGALYIDQGKLAEAEAMYIRALEGKEKALGREHLSTLDTAHYLGALHQTQDRLAEAEAMYTRALEGREKTLGRDHTSTLATASNLGALYLDQSRLAEAEVMLSRALEGREKALGLEHTSTLDTVHHLGMLYQAQDRLAEAEIMHTRALEGIKKALGRDHLLPKANGFQGSVESIRFGQIRPT